MLRTSHDTNGGGGNGHDPVLIDVTEIRRHLEIIHAHAAKLAVPIIAKGLDPGRLQLEFINPADGTIQFYEYAIGNVEGMVKDAIQYANIGWNVYTGVRTVRSDLRVGRGKTEDTVFVFGHGADPDPDKGRT